MSQQTSDTGVPTFELRHRLHRALEVGDVTVVEMAEAIGYSEKMTRNYLRGSHVPRRGTVSEWAIRCGVPVGWLRDGIEPQNGPDGDGATSDQGIITSPQKANRSLPPTVIPLRSARAA